jgi:hypothetical protein
MKKALLSLSFAIAGLIAFAQSGNVVLFTEMGENFTAYLNSVKQNDSPTNNLKIENLNQEFYQLRIDFEDPSYQDFSSNLGVEFGMEWSMVIRVGRKGSYVLRPFSSAAVGSTSAPAQPAVQVQQPAPVQQQTRTIEEEVFITETPGVAVQTTTTTVKTNQTDNVDVKINVPGFDMKVEMTVPNMDTEVEYRETTTTTTTKVVNPGQSERLSRPVPVEEEVVVAMPGYNGPTGCSWPAADSDISQLKSSVESKSFEDSKLSTMKSATKNKCLKATQVKDLMMLLTFEESRLDFAKFAYDYTYDQGNYYVVNDAFTFEFSIDELNEYLEGR